MSTPGTVNFPTSLDDAVSMIEVANNASTTLTAAATNSATTLTVASTASFSSTGAISVDGEVMYYTAKTSTTFTVIRGADGTTAAAHSSGAAVEMLIVAAHHRTLATALIAVETKVGPGAAGTTGQIAFWSGSPVRLGGSSSLTWDSTNGLYAKASTAGQAQVVIEAGSTPSAVSPALELKDAAGTPNRWWVGAGAVTVTDGKFFIFDKAQTALRLVIDTSGLIGVGTATPSYKLHVSGTGGTQAAVVDTTAAGILAARGATEADLILADNGATTARRAFNWISDGGNMRARLLNDAENSVLQDNIVVLNYDAKVGVGRVPTTYAFEVSGDAWKSGGTGSWNIPSDARVKQNIIPFTDGLNVLRRINPIAFQYNGKGGTIANNKTEVGVLAQQIREVMPYTVSTAAVQLNEADSQTTDLYFFNSGALAFVAINALKELDLQLGNMKAELKLLQEAASRHSERMPGLSTAKSDAGSQVQHCSA